MNKPLYRPCAGGLYAADQPMFRGRDDTTIYPPQPWTSVVRAAYEARLRGEELTHAKETEAGTGS